MRRTWIIGLAALALVSCGAEPRGDAASSPVPVDNVLDVTCREDGTTVLQDSEVVAQRDGVHFRVDNRAGEFVSLNGTGMDFSEGVSEEALRVEPGDVRIACWPGSMHGGPEPERLPITIHDPDGHWVPAELECPRDKLIQDSILDYASHSAGEHGDPVDIARDALKGLEEGDRIFTAGYPEAEYRDVAVERDGETVAIVGFSPTDDGGWVIGGYSSCPSSKIRY